MALTLSRSFISHDASTDFPAERERYALYLHYGCPWAQRANIVIHLKGLEKIIPIVVLDPTKTLEGFQFTGKLGTMSKDPFYGYSHIRQLYWRMDPHLKAPFSLPLLWDTKTETIVNNESSEIMRMLYTSFDHLLPEERRELNSPGGGLYPVSLRPQIDEMNTWIQEDISNGVYSCSSATTQEAYDARINILFTAFDRLEHHLARPGHGPYIFGKSITETDIRLFTTLIRFDVVYYTSLHCSLKMIRYDYPKLHGWLRRLYWDETPMTNGGAFRKTTFFDHVSLMLLVYTLMPLFIIESVCLILRKLDQDAVLGLGASWHHACKSKSTDSSTLICDILEFHDLEFILSRSIQP